jgi:hypothetical protein
MTWPWERKVGSTLFRRRMWRVRRVACEERSSLLLVLFSLCASFLTSCRWRDNAAFSCSAL